MKIVEYLHEENKLTVQPPEAFSISQRTFNVSPLTSISYIPLAEFGTKSLTSLQFFALPEKVKERIKNINVLYERNIVKINKLLFT